MAALPLKTMAGQPICMQALQLLHLSGSMWKAGLCFTHFKRAQGRRTTMTEGSSAASSSLMAASVAFRSWGSTTRTRFTPQASAIFSAESWAVGCSLSVMPVRGFC